MVSAVWFIAESIGDDSLFTGGELFAAIETEPFIVPASPDIAKNIKSPARIRMNTPDMVNSLILNFFFFIIWRLVK
jgi:hypothetical protein